MIRQGREFDPRIDQTSLFAVLGLFFFVLSRLVLALASILAFRLAFLLASLDQSLPAQTLLEHGHHAYTRGYETLRSRVRPKFKHLIRIFDVSITAQAASC